MGQLVFVIRISVPFTSLCQRIARSPPQARCSENVAIGFKTSIEAYFVEKTALGRRSCSRLAKIRHNFWTKRFYKNRLLKNRSRIVINPLVSSFCDSNVSGGRLEPTHTHTHTHTHTDTHTRGTTTVTLARVNKDRLCSMMYIVYTYC